MLKPLIFYILIFSNCQGQENGFDNPEFNKNFNESKAKTNLSKELGNDWNTGGLDMNFPLRAFVDFLDSLEETRKPIGEEGDLGKNHFEGQLDTITEDNTSDLNKFWAIVNDIEFKKGLTFDTFFTIGTDDMTVEIKQGTYPYQQTLARAVFGKPLTIHGKVKEPLKIRLNKEREMLLGGYDSRQLIFEDSADYWIVTFPDTLLLDNENIQVNGKEYTNPKFLYNEDLIRDNCGQWWERNIEYGEWENRKAEIKRTKFPEYTLEDMMVYSVVQLPPEFLPCYEPKESTTTEYRFDPNNKIEYSRTVKVTYKKIEL